MTSQGPVAPEYERMLRGEADALREGERRYRELFERMTEGFAHHEIVCDAAGVPVDYRFLEVNPAFERLTGLSRERVVGRLVREVLPDNDPEWIEIYGQVALSGEPRHFDLHSAALGRHYDVVAYSPRRGEFATIFLDVTERRRMDEALRESEERFRALADNIPQLAWMADGSGAIVWYNRRWYEYTGTTLEEMQGWGWDKVHDPAHLGRVLERWREGLRAGVGWEDTFPLRRHDGAWRWFLSRAQPIRDDAGRVLRWFGTNTDITAEREATERAAESDRRKGEFIAILSHELRNPLAPISNALHVLDRSSDPETSARARAVLRRQVDHLKLLVDDLLDVTRISSGKIELRRARVDAVELVRRACEDHRPMFAHEEIALDLEVPREPVWVDADETRIAQVLGNALQNALRFARRNGRASVSLAVRGDRAVVSVRDDGAGIDAELAGRLFEPFAQGDRGLARTSGGLGLGLALVKGLVELHGGEVRIRSEGRGRGAELEVKLPLADAASAPAPSVEPAGRVAPLDVLVVEDNPDAGETLGELLRLLGHRTRLAATGSAGLDAARTAAPDLVLCDIGLPDLDGYEVARRLRAEPALSRALLVALSGYAQPEDRRRAAEAGFDAHVAKPPSLESIEALLARAAAARRR